MIVAVLLFASLAESAERERFLVELEAPTTAGELRDRVLSEVGTRGIRGAVRVAVNESFVDDSFVLSEGDEVALIPPVAGG